MRPDLDDFEEMNQDPELEPRSRAMSWLVLSVAVVGFAALAYYAYQSGTRSVNDGNVLVVNAEPGAIKETPANPGGEDFPNKDKTIYNAMTPSENSQKVEKLLPEAEKPVIPEPAVTAAKEAAPAPAKETAKPSTTTFINSALSDKQNAENEEETEAAPPQKVTAEQTKPAPAPAEAAEAKVVAAEKAAASAPAPAAAKTEEPAPAPTAKPVAKAAAKPAAKPASSGSAYKIQLGAFKSEAEAKANWKRITSAHGDIVKGSPIILKADLSNGTFYRLRASGFDSVKDAKAACDKLMAARQPCFYIGK